jgi:transposase
VSVNIKTPTREEFIELCRTSPEKAADILVSMAAALALLEERVTQLEEQLRQDSHNSNKPPSSDGFKRNTKSTRAPSNRSSGAQDGHKGSTLKMVAAPHRILRHSVPACKACGRSLRTVKPSVHDRRQVFDIPAPRVEVTEHQCETKECPHCGVTTTASFPSGVTKATQYGANLKSFAMYLMQYQLIPSQRTHEALKDLFGCSIAEGSLFNWTKELHATLKTHEQTVKEHLQHQSVIHADETGLLCEQKLHWLHVSSTERLTSYALHPKRGTEALNAIGILPEFRGTVIHDSWKPYFSYDCTHSVCNAHIIRELTFAFEEDRQPWANDFKELLLRINHRVERSRGEGNRFLPPRTLHHFERQYDHLLWLALRRNPRQRGSPHRRGRKKQTKTRNLVERLRDYRAAVLAFMYDFRVAFTNNQAERDLRMAKVKQKISGTFRSQAGAEMFCRIRGYISTARKNTLSAFDAIAHAFLGDPFIPQLLLAE